jgi:hypothetical protein
MAIDIYVLGQQATFTATLVDEDGDAADPDALTLLITSPDGVETVYELADLTNPTVGTYKLNVLLDQTGTWKARMASVNPDDAAEGVLRVESSYPVSA